jgi:fimbrial chaperone protein
MKSSTSISIFKKSGFLKTALLGLAVLFSAQSFAGISIGATRIIYPYGASSTNVKIMNSSEENSFLIQSWVENEDGEKSKDFVVTPPLYVSGPKNENSLRIMYSGGPLPQDRETVFYFVSKAIPSIDKEEIEGKNMMMLTAANRIKLFVRPAGLKDDVTKAPGELNFRMANGKLEVTNPTPYYQTVAELKAGTQSLSTIMVPPKNSMSVDLPSGSGSEISYRTINDQGAMTPVTKKSAK